MALDPGTHKFGWAHLNGDGHILGKGMESTKNLGDFLDSLSQGKDDLTMVLGDATARTLFFDLMEARHWEVILQDERNSTLEGRRLYFELYPPQGWRAWVPISLLHPKEPFDDCVAVVIGRRYLKNLKESGSGP